MPNWCTNYIVVESGDDTAEFARFLDIINANKRTDNDTTVSLLGTFVPRPEFPEGDDGWYQWSYDHWGTKWEDESVIMDTFDKAIHFQSETAWAPPLAGLCAISAQFPTLTISVEFDECGMAFLGAAIYRDGIGAVSEENWPEVSDDEEPNDNEDNEWELVHDATERCAARVKQELEEMEASK